MSSSNKRSSGRRGPTRRMEFPNDPEAFSIHGSSSSPSSSSQVPSSISGPPPTAPLAPSSAIKSSTAAGSCDSSPSPLSAEDCLTIAPSNPLKLLPNQLRKALPKIVRQDMLPASGSGITTPERSSPGQEGGSSGSQLDLGTPRPSGHGRTPSLGTPTGSSAVLRRNGSSIITNVDKHGGPRRRRSKTNLRSTSRSQSRPGSPTGSICSDISSISGKSLTIVLKLGTSSICDSVTHMPMLANLSLMVETIVKLKELGHRVVLVSSGAVGLGMRRLGIPVKPKELAVIQAIAAVGQGRLMALYDDLFGQLAQPVAQVLLTRNDLSQRTQYLNACNTFEALLEMNVVPIVNENDTVSLGEIRFGDNDTLSAITAGMVHADYLFLLTD
ncbi:Glutamate 5-kinase, partial [Coemansia sp. S2]